MKELEKTYARPFPAELRCYLLREYAEEPFPYEYSELDLYTRIDKDIRAYEAGKLDVTTKSPAVRWQEERRYLQNLFLEKAREAGHLADYVEQLERILSENGLGSPVMAQRRKNSF